MSAGGRKRGWARDPVRRYFEVAEKGENKVARTQCCYCKKSFSAVNPSRLQGHLVKCVAFQQRPRSQTPEEESSPEPLVPSRSIKNVVQQIPSQRTAVALPAFSPFHPLPVSTGTATSNNLAPEKRTRSETQPKSVSRVPPTPRSTPLYSPRYEKVVLEANAIFVQLFGYILPEELAQINTTILSRTASSSSPAVDNSSAQQMAFRIANSHTTSDIAEFLFPREDDETTSNLARAIRMPFAEDAVPQGVPWDRGVQGERLTSPVPDLTFGYTEDTDFEIMRTQCAHFRGIDLVGVCSPIPGLYRPFLTVELKSTASPFLSARNSTAGAGAACVYSARSMSMLSPGVQYNRQLAMAYSCTVVGCFAVLWIHWTEPRKSINIAPVETYNLAKGEDLVKLKRQLANVIEWGITDRWSMQREHLKAIQAAMRRDFESNASRS